MKTAIVCAMIFSQISAEARELTPVRAQRSVVRSCPSVPVVAECVRNGINRYPAPVGEIIHEDGSMVEGVFLRVATAPKPLNMVNPLAPPQYGSAKYLVTYREYPLSSTDHDTRRGIQPNGIRLLTLSSLW